MSSVDSRPRTRLSRAAAILPTTVAVVLATVAISSIESATTVTSAPPTLSRPAARPTGDLQVLLRLSDNSATVTLNDTAAAQEFAAQLPMRLTLRDPMGQAKSGRLAVPLAVGDADPIVKAEVAGLYYWQPTGDIGIVYDDLGQTVPAPGMVQLGTVTSGLEVIAAAGNRFTVSIERV